MHSEIAKALRLTKTKPNLKLQNNESPPSLLRSADSYSIEIIVRLPTISLIPLSDGGRTEEIGDSSS